MSDDIQALDSSWKWRPKSAPRYFKNNTNMSINERRSHAGENQPTSIFISFHLPYRVESLLSNTSWGSRRQSLSFRFVLPSLQLSCDERRSHGGGRAEGKKVAGEVLEGVSGVIIPRRWGRRRDWGGGAVIGEGLYGHIWMRPFYCTDFVCTKWYYLLN